MCAVPVLCALPVPAAEAVCAAWAGVETAPNVEAPAGVDALDTAAALEVLEVVCPVVALYGAVWEAAVGCKGVSVSCVRVARDEVGACAAAGVTAGVMKVQLPASFLVLQCVAVCCSVLQCVAVCCSALQCVAVSCSVLQCVAVCCR